MQLIVHKKLKKSVVFKVPPGKTYRLHENYFDNEIGAQRKRRVRLLMFATGFFLCRFYGSYQRKVWPITTIFTNF